jgi:hypothetical protein
MTTANGADRALLEHCHPHAGLTRRRATRRVHRDQAGILSRQAREKYVNFSHKTSTLVMNLHEPR